MTTNDGADQRPRRTDKLSLPGRVVLVMQGGGAPGCYQAGAYQALHEAGIEPDWVIGTSIGAINGAIIAGNQVADRVKRLREFWERLETPLSELTPLVAGVPGYYYLNPALAWGVNARVGIEQAAMFLVDPLKTLLPAVVDFNLINSGRTKLASSTSSARAPFRRAFPQFSLMESIIGTEASIQIHQWRWFSMRTRGIVPSCSRYRYGTREARNPNHSHMLSCGKKIYCSEADLGSTSCDKPSFIGCAALSANWSICCPKSVRVLRELKSSPVGAAQPPCIWWR